jgi:hypothetical protein
MVAGVCIATLAGCAAAPPPNHAWSDRMSALLSDLNGHGGGGGDLDRAGGARSAQGFLELADVSSGKYDVLAVCSGTGIVQITVTAITSPRAVLASSDIACGATLRLPITVSSPGIVLRATTTDTNAQWQAAVVTPGWEPDPTNYSR